MNLEHLEGGEENLKKLIPIQKIWESQSSKNATGLLSKAKNYLITLPQLVGTGPSTTVVLDLNNSQYEAMTGDFEKVFGVVYEKNMRLNSLTPFYYNDHNSFIAQHFPEFLKYLLACEPSKRDNIELTIIFKYRRKERLYWINQRIFKYFNDPSGKLGYVIMEYTDITNVKSDPNARFVVYDKRKGYLINEIYKSNSITLSALTATELEITKLVAQGMSNKEVSTSQKISIETVKQHKKNIFIKLGIHKSIELVAIAYENDLT